MGLCMTRCYSEVQRMSCWQWKSRIEDRDRLVDFDMFLDDEPAPRPLSISSWLSCVRGQLGIDNEEVELQEEFAANACREAVRVQHIAESSAEPMNPAQLALDNVALWKLDQFCPDAKESQVQDMSWDAETKPKGNNSGSSPSSSVDLEWENEDGLSPVLRDDASSDTANCSSRLSTPVSNGNEELEWDGHFTSTHISQLDMETEHLVSEIQRLTSGALADQKTEN